MEKIRCLVVDDEPNAIRLIRSHIDKIDNLFVVGEFANGIDAISFLSKNSVDLIFLDIQMPDLTGLDLIKTLINPPKMIITTAFREYALEGFELEVVDYLLKPITFVRFMKAVVKYKTFFKEREITNFPEETIKEDFIFLKEGKKTHKLKYSEILYIEGLNEYIKIHAIHCRIILKQSLISMEKTLPENMFLRIHKSYIISINNIKAFTNHSVEINDLELPIGKSYKGKVLEKISKTSKGNTNS